MILEEEKDFQEFTELFDRNMLTTNPSTKIREWQKKGLLEKYLKPLEKCVTVDQDYRYHQDTVFEHCLKTCDSTPPNLVLRWAGLLHDIGKAKTLNYRAECGLLAPDDLEFSSCPFRFQNPCNTNCKHVIWRPTFYRHEYASKHISVKLLRTFGVTNKQKREIVFLVMHHMYRYQPEWTEEALCRFIKKTKIKLDDLEDADSYPLFMLRRADRLSRGLEPVAESQREFEGRLRDYLGSKLNGCKKETISI